MKRFALLIIGMTSAANAAVLQVPGAPEPEKCETRPVGATFKGKAYIAYAGTDSDHHPNIVSSDDLSNWSKVVLPEAVLDSGGVALAEFNGKLYLLYTGTDRRLNLFSTTDGVSWGNKITFSSGLVSTKFQPGMTAHAGRLVISFSDVDQRINILHAATPEVEAFWILELYAGGAVPNSRYGLSMASFDGKLLNAYVGTDSDHFLNLQSLRDYGFGGINPGYVSSDSSDDGFWITPFNGALHVAWRGSGNDNLNIGEFSVGALSSALGTTGGPVPLRRTAAQSALGPSLGALGNRLFILWKGSDERVNLQPIASAPQRVCATWPVQFLDSGYGESVQSATGPQQAAASYAQFAIAGGTRTIASGFLDQDGCTDVIEPIPSGSTIELTTNLGRNRGVPNGPLRERILVRTVAPAFRTPLNRSPEDKERNSSPATMRALLNPGSLQQQSVALVATNPDEAEAARVAAILGQSLRADLLANSLANGLAVVAFAGDGCPSAGLERDSCADGARLFVGPPDPTDPNRIPQSQYKFIIAHELAHSAEFAQGSQADREGYPVINGLPDSCECRHVTVANAYHCLQSAELAVDSRTEGFAQFGAARTFNLTTDLNPTFVYYKEFLWDQCPAGVNCESFNRKFKQFPPVAVSAKNAALWRNRNCGDPGNKELATEFDWMNFYWNATDGSANAVTLEELFAIGRAQGGRRLSNDAYLALARGVVGDVKGSEFVTRGDEFGVNSNTSRR
jgi:hypothetical protein